MGIIIAVFGMRIVFPLLIVVVAAGVGPWEVITGSPRPMNMRIIGARIRRLPTAAPS